jgi:FG-GAP-like repeat
MSALSIARSRTGPGGVLAALTAVLAIILFTAPKADAIGLGPAGWYSFGDNDCNEDSRSDPIGVLFRGRRASAHNVANQIKHHAGWWNDVTKDQYLWVLLNGGSYDCREANESVAEASDIGPYSRYHTRLWFIPATNGSSELKTIGTPHHEDWKWRNPFNHCSGATQVGSHAVDKGGVNQSTHESGFDRGRHKLKEAFQNAGHLVQPPEEWGNTYEIEQCDEEWAGSDGWGLSIWVNHAVSAHTKGGSVTESSATLKGTLFTEEPTTEWWFAYGPNPSQGISGYPYKTAVQSTSATGEFNVNEPVSGLSPNTTYYVRMFARNQDGEVEEGNQLQYRSGVLRDLYGVLMNKAGSGKTELHILDSATNYMTFRLQVPTALGETKASQWQFAYGDYNGDGIPDLYGVLMNGPTGTGKTELHILDGASNYSSGLLSVGTGLGETTASQWQFAVGDYNRDGIPDLYGVLMNGPTGTGKTELHIFDGATNYSTALLRVGTGLGETTTSQWQYAVGDYNRDGIPDLYGVLMNGPTGTGKTEVHIFDGATNYATALLRGGTTLGETKPQQWQFSVGEYNGDGIPDLYGVLMNGPTGTGKTELHILNGASSYSTGLLSVGTALSETAASQWQFGGAHVSGDWHPVATTEAASSVGADAATLKGAVNPRGLSTTYHFDYGTTTSYGSSTAESLSIGNGTSNVTVSRAAVGLSPGTSYHFRVVATNLEGTSYGQDMTFKTAESPQPPWTIQPSSKTAGFLKDVSCFSATDCTAVGYSGQWAIAQRWNGSEWTEPQTVAKPTGAASTVLEGVSCTSSSACSAVGYYVNSSSQRVALAESWNGSEWKVQGTENPSGSTVVQLEDVSCASASECVAVGSYFSSETERTLIERFNGTSWKIETSKNGSASNNRLTSVSCPSASFCMAAGFYYESSVNAWLPLTESWSGGVWTQRTAVKPAGSTNSYFYGVSCTSSTACTAVGDWLVIQTVSEYTLAQRWNGSTWAIQTTPNPESTSLDIADVSCTTSSACTAVGSYIDTVNVEHPMAMVSSDGTSWTMQFPPLPAGDQKVHPYGVSCVVSRGCEAVGFHKTAAGSFLTLAEGYWRGPPPTASTKAATLIGDSGATLNGSVNPNGAETKYFFEYGTTTSYGSKTSEALAGSGTTAVEKSQAISGLSPNTTYHYRVVAKNDNPDPAYGADLTFRTSGPPTVSIGAAVPDPNGKAATLNATINPNGHGTTYQFEYGKTSSYGSKVPPTPASAGSGTSPVNVSEALSGLEPGTTYYYGVAATNEAGTVKSEGKTFKTESASGVPTQLNGMAVTEPFDGSTASLTRFGSSWSTLGWANGITPKGEDSTSGWRPVSAYPAVAGAYYNPVITDTGSGVAAVATMAANPLGVSRYFSLWLDMPTPGSASRDGYELRFTYTATNTYTVTLAKWQKGTETALGTQSGYTFVNGSSFAIVDAGSTVSAWTAASGSGFSQLLSAADSAFAGGNAGLEGSGNITRITNFKVGALSPVANMDAALKALPVRDSFTTGENPLSGGGAWVALSWANSTSGHNTGWVSGGWGPYDAFSTVNGASWQKAPFADTGAGVGVVATLSANPANASRYFSLWLDMPAPSSARTGYELRFTETSTNTYEVAIARWQAGTKTNLASKSGYSFPTKNQFALVEKAGTVSAWANMGSGYTQVLSAADSSLSNGYTGIEGSGNITRLTNFSAGPLPPF